MLRPPHVEQRQQLDRKETQQALEDSAHAIPDCRSAIHDAWAYVPAYTQDAKVPESEEEKVKKIPHVFVLASAPAASHRQAGADQNKPGLGGSGAKQVLRSATN